MLPETASSTADRPIFRSAQRTPPSPDNALRDDIREMVGTVLLIEREIYRPEEAAPGTEQIMVVNPQSRLVVTFEGRLMLDSEAAYDQLDRLLAPFNYLPVFRTGQDDMHVIHVLSGRVEPKPRAVWLNIVLFVLTVFSVLLVGTEVALGEIAFADQARANALVERFWLELWRGIPYAAAIILILGAHEMGHYFAARRHKIAVTLPYFIPAPFISFLGTFGAAIQLREPMRNRKVLFDVGAAGPLTGLVFAIPILFIGLATSPVGPISPGGWLEGNSLVYALSKIIVFGRFLPDGQVDVYINQLARAGWAGLLVTALNLIPLGQLDGGHILYSLVGDKARKLFYPLLAAAVGLAFLNEAWILWLVLIFLLGRVYAVPLDTITPLDERRRWLAIASLLIFVAIFVPVPLTQIPDTTTTPVPRNSVELFTLASVFLAALWLRLRR